MDNHTCKMINKEKVKVIRREYKKISRESKTSGGGTITQQEKQAEENARTQPFKLPAKRKEYKNIVGKVKASRR